MPTWSIFSGRSGRNKSTTSFQTVDSLPSHGSTGEFHLPTHPKKVTKQIHRTGPVTLPDANANHHEVRYFLFQLLTIESYQLAKKDSAQWVLETCAKWTDNGAALREMSETDLRLLCPLDSGYCKLDERYTDKKQFPPPRLRRAIGEAIAGEVTRLKAKENQKARLQREWKETQLGGSARQRVIYGRLRNQASSQSLFLNTGVQRPLPLRSAQSAISMPTRPATIAAQGRHERQRDLPEELRPESIYAPSSRASMYPRRSTMDETMTDARLPTSSGDGSNSSGNTNSTAQTSPPGSMKEMTKKQTAISQVVPDRPCSVISSKPSHSRVSRSAMGAQLKASSHTLSGHEHYSSTATAEGDYFTQSRMPSIYEEAEHVSTPHPSCQDSVTPALLTLENIREFEAFSGRPSKKAPRIIMHAPPVEQRTKFNTMQAWQNVPGYQTHFTNSSNDSVGYGNAQLQSQYFPPVDFKFPTLGVDIPQTRGVNPPPRYLVASTSNLQVLEKDFDTMSIKSSFSFAPSISRSEIGYRSSPSSLKRQPIAPSLTNFPYPSIQGPRSSSPSPSICPTAPRSVAPSILYSPLYNSPLEYTPSLSSQYNAPLTSKRSAPVLSSFAHPSRPSTYASMDAFALAQGAYTTFKAGQSAARSELIQQEIERMAGMVPGRLHGEGMESLGPAVRLLGGDGRPMRTLVEQIREKEILDGRKQGGAGARRWRP